MRTPAKLPVTEIKRRATKIIAELEADQPLMITEHGRSRAVLLDALSYERLVRRVEILEGIARGERAISEGRVVSHAAARRRLRKWLRTS